MRIGNSRTPFVVSWLFCWLAVLELVGVFVPNLCKVFDEGALFMGEGTQVPDPGVLAPSGPGFGASRRCLIVDCDFVFPLLVSLPRYGVVVHT